MSTHRIQRGDTLSQLAQRYGTSVKALAEANNIQNPDRIIAGRTLQVPDGFDRPAPSGAAPGGSAAPQPGGTDHAGHTHPEGSTTTAPAPTGGANGIHAGRGWGGSEGVADAAKSIAQELGIPVTSQKRNAAETQRLDANFRSDHFTGNENAFAVDFGVAGQRGDQLARAIAQRYGIPEGNIGTYNRHVINVDGQRYSLQLLWRVEGHFNHVHFGIRRA
jgi:murein DD-endopeptidase MepM/ murein hydrolase activator NlpD